MNLILCVEAYFGRLEDETIEPILYRDGSSYERMSATWYDNRELPSEADLQTYWTQTGASLAQQIEAQSDVSETELQIAALGMQIYALQQQINQLTAQLADAAAQGYTP